MDDFKPNPTPFTPGALPLAVARARGLRAAPCSDVRRCLALNFYQAGTLAPTRCLRCGQPTIAPR